jgi:hypothetical protein
MRTVLRSLLFLCLLVCAARISHAQGCRTIYFANYSTYATESSDGTNIFTTVLTDGSTTGGPPGPGCPMGPAFHYATSTNTINSVGGTMNGAHQCVGCYLSVQNNQQVPAQEGIDYNFYGAGTVICSVAGTWWGGGADPMGVGLHRTSYQSDGSPTNCTLTPTCPAGQTPVCGAQSFSTGSACQGPWMSILYLGTTDNRTKSKSCYGVGKPVWRSQIGTCD